MTAPTPPAAPAAAAPGHDGAAGGGRGPANRWLLLGAGLALLVTMGAVAYRERASLVSPFLASVRNEEQMAADRDNPPAEEDELVPGSVGLEVAAAPGGDREGAGDGGAPAADAEPANMTTWQHGDGLTPDGTVSAVAVDAPQEDEEIGASEGEDGSGNEEGDEDGAPASTGDDGNEPSEHADEGDSGSGSVHDASPSHKPARHPKPSPAAHGGGGSGGGGGGSKPASTAGGRTPRSHTTGGQLLLVLNSTGWDAHPQWLAASCGPKWASMLAEYVAFHARGVAALRAGSYAARHGDIRLVVFRCRLDDACGGVGDRLVGMASVFLYALRTRRLFFIDWTLFDGFMTSPFPGLDWRWRHEYALDRKPTYINMHQCRYTCLWTQGQSGNKARALTKPFLVLSINRGPLWAKYGGTARQGVEEWLRALTPPGSSAGVGCLYRSMFTPGPALRSFLAPWLPHFRPAEGRHVVAVHIRQGDTAMIVKPGGSPLVNTKNFAVSGKGYFTLMKDVGRFFECGADVRREMIAALKAAGRWAPAAPAEGDGAAPDGSPPPPSEVVRILVVSDSEVVRDAARRHFNGAGAGGDGGDSKKKQRRHGNMKHLGDDSDKAAAAADGTAAAADDSGADTGSGSSVLLDTGIRAQHISWMDRKVLGRKFLGDRLEYEAGVLRTSLAEWYLLSQADAVVAHVSGFSRTAAAYGSTHNAIRMAMERCRPVTAFDLSHYGAGI